MAITLDQNVGSTGVTFDAVSTSIALSSAVVAQQLLTLVVNLNTSNTTVLTVTDSLLSVWTKAASIQNSTAGTGPADTELWYVLAQTNGTPTVTVTVTSTFATNKSGLGLHAWLGASTAVGVLVQAASTKLNTSNQTMTSINATSSNLVLANWYRAAGGTFRSDPTGYSSVAPHNSTEFETMYKIMGGSSAEAGVWTMTAVGKSVEVVAEFAVSTAGGAAAVVNPPRFTLLGVQ